MTKIQEDFLNEIKNLLDPTIATYRALYDKHYKIAIEEQISNGASQLQAKTMSQYYTVSVLGDYLKNENFLTAIMDLKKDEY